MTKHIHTHNDTWEIGGKTLSSRLLIGSALYPSPATMEDAIKVSGAQIVTVALRRQAAGNSESKGGNQFWDIIKFMFYPIPQVHTLPKKPLPQHRWREKYLVQTG